ncbi:MAG: DNA-3-methyladenine glycosylase family protein [Candidatus Thorarchaeota archaeon]|jgi:3-methyladenine DNA glycosylase/8-oxoguanine DNA glycosylase
MGPPIALRAKQVVELLPSSPFSFDATMHKPDHFPSTDNDWEAGVRWQTMLWDKKPLGLKFESQGSINQPSISLSIWSQKKLAPHFLDSLTREINYRLNLHLDLTEFYQSLRNNPELAPVMKRWRGMRPLNLSSLYEYLIVAIVLQNATVRRSVNMLQALFRAFGTLLAYDDKELYCFWEPEAVHKAAEQKLRELKVGYRAKSIKRVTEAFVVGEINEFELREKPREEQRKALLGLYGVGPASVGYILSDVFHHLDELEHISPWEQKIYSKLFFDTDPSEPVSVDRLFAHFNEQFGMYKMLAVHYVWEDLFWKRKHGDVEWLKDLIRL